MFIYLIIYRNYSTPAGVEELNMITAINIKILWFCGCYNIFAYMSNSIKRFKKSKSKQKFV